MPGFREQVTRPKFVTIKAQNAKGEWYEKSAEDLLARAFLHETDHLNGKLYITHVSMLKRDLIRRKVREATKSRRVGLSANRLPRHAALRRPHAGTHRGDGARSRRCLHTARSRPRGRGQQTGFSPVKEAAPAPEHPLCTNRSACAVRKRWNCSPA